MVGAKESCRCSIVDVFTGEKGLDECLLVGKMREHTQLDLRVIGRNQHATRRRNEGASNLAAEFAPDWNVLKIRLRAAETPGRRDRLVEAGMHPPRNGMNHQRQCVDIRALQFLQSAPVQNKAGQLVGK